MKEWTEQRKHKRFRAQYGAVAALDNMSDVRLGLITDISKGGLAFCYVDHGTHLETEGREDSKLEISLTAKDFYLDKLLCRLVLDCDIPAEESATLLPMKKCSVQFAELAPHQVSQLDYFLENFTK